MIKKSFFVCVGLAAILGCGGSGSGSQAIIEFNESLIWAVGLVSASPAPPAGSPQVVTASLPGGFTEEVYQPGGIELIDGNAVLMNRMLPKFVPTTNAPDPENDRGKIFIDGVDTGLKLNAQGMIENATGVVHSMAIPRGQRTYRIAGPLEASDGSRSLYVREEVILNIMIPNNGQTTFPSQWNGRLPANSGTTSDVNLQLTVPSYVATAGKELVFGMGAFGPFGYAPTSLGNVLVNLPQGTAPITIPSDGVDSLTILSYENP